MSRRQRVADLGGHGRQLHDGLGDPATRIGRDLAADRRQFLFRGVGPEDDSVAAGTLDRFDDQLVDAVEHLSPLGVEPAAKRIDIGQ